MSNRLEHWKEFNKHVEEHIEEYTIPQYGDFPHDLITEAPDQYVITTIRKYASRLDTSSRGEEDSLRDLYKIAHLAQMLWTRRTSNQTSEE